MKPRGPELIWPGKYDDDGQRVEVPRPGAVLEVRERIGGSASCDRLLHGDNLEALDALHATHRGKVDLVYIDPPFATGGRFSVATRVGQSQGRKAAPEISAPAYSDRFDAGATGFLQMLEPRLRLMHELLSPRGSFYLHVDPTVGHMVKLLLDEVFGATCFQREIVWRIGWVSGFKSKAKNWIRNHDLIFFYVKDPRAFTFNKKYVPYPPGYVRRDGKPPTGKGVPIDDVWNANESEFALRGKESLDSIQIKSFSNEKCGYATQKNESLATRIIEASSNPGDLVADFFCGSGTVGVAARRLGRRFVGSDCSAAAVHIAKKRLLEVESEAALSIERAHVPGRAQDHCAQVAAHMGLSMDPAGRFHARREGRAVHIAEADARMNAETIASLCAELPDDVEGLDVVSSRYDLPLLWSPPSGVAVRLLRVTEEVHNAAASTVHGAAIRELPRVQLQAVLVDEGFALELVAYDLDPQSLQPQLRDALREPLDLVDAWSVTWRATPLLAVQTDAVFQRTHQRRTLPTRTNVQPLPSEPVTVTIRVVDVLYQHSTITARVQPCADGVVLTDLRLC